MDLVDLHTHSTASDGTLGPGELVAEAARLGLKAVALTDHDTVAGLAEAMAAGREHGIEVVPGCELGVESSLPMHILGLWLPERPARLMKAMEFLVAKRHDRNRVIVEKLRAAGMTIDYAEVEALAQGTVGRPHIARVMLAKGYVSSIQQAFDLYLGSRGRAFVPKVKFNTDEAIALLKDEGATVLLAHPYLLSLTTSQLEYRLKELMAMGLDGIEAYYTEHSDQQTRNYLRMADRLGLAVSGGTDFHGSVKPRTRLGVGKGGLRVSLTVLTKLKDFRRARGLRA